MTDLYADLGLERGAGADAIKAAYRKLSKQHHPDLAGGDRAQFERIKRAFKILSHPERRKVYDETGQAEEAQADNAEALARTVLAQVFRKIIAERADWIFHIDVVGEMETEIKHTIKSNKTEAQKARSRTRT